MTLPTALLEPTVRRALAEDLGTAASCTTNAIVPPDHPSGFDVLARQPGAIPGLNAATLAWRLLDSEVQVDVRLGEGASVTPGDVVATVFGPTRALLSGERVALNLLCHLSGVASATAGLVAAVAHTRARITCTRKTTVGLRALEKAAVRAGPPGSSDQARRAIQASSSTASTPPAPISRRERRSLTRQASWKNAAP